MIVQRIRTAARRAVIFLGIIAVIFCALVTVEAAAQWRAQTATFDPVPAVAISATDAAANEAIAGGLSVGGVGVGEGGDELLDGPGIARRTARFGGADRTQRQRDQHARQRLGHGRIV